MGATFNSQNTETRQLQAVVIPTRRNTANSWQILLSHMFGDASSPYIVGMISDKIRGDDSSPYGNFHSLVTSFYLPNALLLVSAVLYFFAAFTFVRDNNKFKKQMGVLKLTSEPSASQGNVPPPVGEEIQASQDEEPDFALK
ncbi:hypothetical protein Y032_0421g1177 [Ancylostoma ceylanicum]|nr:hypothetical protein Y032_0421g1177 [Ancylostoma ceylanicum]